MTTPAGGYLLLLFLFAMGRLLGLWDAWRGKTGWEKFAWVGFREGVAPAHG